MASEHARFSTPPHPCVYLPGLSARFDVRLLTAISPRETEHLVERGWRRFGMEYFRPNCAGCGQCISLRVPVREFAPSKSQRRAIRKCAGLAVRVGLPVVDAARLALYGKWHASREAECGWEANGLDWEGYARQFCFPHPCAREMTYWHGKRLAGVGLVDEMPRSLSSIYFFFDPEYARLSPGIFSALCEISLAQRMGKDHLYFGYCVPGCKSLIYKAQFRPRELLAGRPSDGEWPLWMTAGDDWMNPGGSQKVESEAAESPEKCEP